MSKILIRSLHLLFVLLTPLVVVLGSVRLLTIEQYLAFEYGRANFPPDTYGFTPDERMSLAATNLRFVRDGLPVETLASQTNDGELIYTPRELDHMLDVQQVFQMIWRVGLAAILSILFAGILLWVSGYKTTLPSAMRSGGTLTVSLMLAIALTATLAWQNWFTSFHLVFFEQDSWLFAYSDTLIRLFPLRFWVDATYSLASLSLAIGLLLVFTGWYWQPLS